MFIGNDILDFINKIINQVEGTDEEIEQNLNQFRNYLELTQMVDGETLKRIDDIVECLEYLIALKNKLGFVDVKAVVPPDEEKQKALKKVRKVKKPTPRKNPEPKPVIVEKHYHHYSSDYGSSCGCGSSYSSYSSGCGGGGSYRSGC